MFRNDHELLAQYPECNSCRYISEESCIAFRKFTYLLLKPRIAGFFGTSNLSGVLQAHLQPDLLRALSDSDRTVHDIHQSNTWRDAYSSEGIFHGNP